MKTELMTAVMPLVGSLVGAGVTHVLGGKAEAKKQRDLLRSAAYVDFLRGVALLSATQHIYAPGEKSFEATVLVGDAKARIAIYGSEAVVRAVSEVSDNLSLDILKDSEAFVSICRRMRTDTEKKVALTDQEIKRVLFGAGLDTLPEK